MPSPKPFILNLTEKVSHRRAGLTESCNTDAILKRRNSAIVPPNFRECEHCSPSESPYSESMAFRSEP